MTEGYFDLGSYHRDVQSPSAQAQLWFDRGLVWAYAFNHDEAIRCFDKALSLDPELAIARWGVAYAIRPNYNKAWEAFDPVDLAASVARARMELQLAAQAGRLRSNAAWSTRFPTASPPTTPRMPTSSPETSGLSRLGRCGVVGRSGAMTLPRSCERVPVECRGRQ